MTLNRDIIHPNGYNKSINDAFGNAFRHSAAAALMVYYGYQPEQVASMGDGIETFESAVSLIKWNYGIPAKLAGWFSDGQTDVANNLVGIKYAQAHPNATSYQSFLGGLAEQILHTLGVV